MTTDDHPDRDSPGGESLRIVMKRREFLRGLGLLGGALVYSTPLMTACGTGKTGRRGRVFDIELPARYDVTDEQFTLEIEPRGHEPVEVRFRASGAVGLESTDEPDIAEVRLLGVRFESEEESPMRDAGLDFGRIQVGVPDRTRVGTLDLASGKLSENPINVEVSFERDVEPFRTQVRLSSPNVREQARQSGDKCVKTNDITIPTVSGLPSVEGARGRLRLGLTPTVG